MHKKIPFIDMTRKGQVGIQLFVLIFLTYFNIIKVEFRMVSSFHLYGKRLIEQLAC